MSPPGTVFAALRFVPGAAGPALGLPMSELLNQRVDAADLGTGPGTELARALPGTLAPAQALATLTRMAGALIAEGPADPLAARAARLLRHPGARAEGIAGRLEVSERQLRRRCQAAVGYGPATLRRVLRFRRFVSWADAGAPGGGLASAAARLGYADQAHLTRECARLAGVGRTGGPGRGRGPLAILILPLPWSAMIRRAPGGLIRGGPPRHRWPAPTDDRKEVPP